ncbi:MAG: hypothetical protein JKY65_04935 [Planctomycetes bacterium]|nr:hypothetical protein [Planctomycetota bacterium]
MSKLGVDFRRPAGSMSQLCVFGAWAREPCLRVLKYLVLGWSVVANQVRLPQVDDAQGCGESPMHHGLFAPKVEPLKPSTQVTGGTCAASPD